ncbi:MAG: DUF423 domain-containing protein [Fulvivirga sp.]
MTAKQILIAGGLFGILSVAIGAFGAHGLREMLMDNGRLDTFDTAVKYQFYHTLAIIFIGLLMLKIRHKFLTYSAYAMVTGIIIFSGSLYALCITNIPIFGTVTPIGGLMFILGWLFFTLGASKAL